ncbi:DUF6891 domain-containing protein [Rhodopirellula sp. SWK7]|uniref:DUF6891 domain-containing protein n=1 Tax=Rhodopirellula sp. SWK7 TaxID=595460 RepID=UPI0002BD8262|nr:hypothetical protein [Rhodopirellula sp. SWK7]EMI41947.1 hypothetical protein RRSWK_05543 [Rhodopirellula sp. SWK7]
MNDTETYIADQIRLNVWSGLADEATVQQLVSDILEDGANESMLRSLVPKEFASKLEAEKSWPDETDCDKLFSAFESLSANGVIAMHNAGWDKSEAFHNCLEAYREAGSPNELFGICYYTSQDIESAIDKPGIYLGYSSTRPEDEEADAIRAGKLICDEIRATGLKVDWGGDAASRILVHAKWQFRSSASG